MYIRAHHARLANDVAAAATDVYIIRNQHNVVAAVGLPFDLCTSPQLDDRFSLYDNIYI